VGVVCVGSVGETSGVEGELDDSEEQAVMETAERAAAVAKANKNCLFMPLIYNNYVRINVKNRVLSPETSSGSG
jgi:hypothetical protein